MSNFLCLLAAIRSVNEDVCNSVLVSV